MANRCIMRNTIQCCFKRVSALTLLAILTISGVAAQSPKQAPAPLPKPVAPTEIESDAVRFLEQATFGATPGLINRAQSLSFKAYLEEEFSAPMSSYPDLLPFDSDSSIGCPAGSDPNCFRDNYTMYPLQTRFFLNALHGDDQLRQRVAFALHQILVISGVSIQQPSSMAPYLNLLTRSAFGNFRQLLYDITLNPAMGTYLDMANNSKFAPNENYAREIIQLFSIGLHKLNQDGTLQLDGLGQPIPTFDQNTIIGFAKIFTGWTYAPKPGAASQWPNPEYYLAPMVAFQNRHDLTAKPLLNGVVSPANLTAKKDLSFALDNIFNHPNVAPFICKQLIQHLVTSNPTPGYVSRVSAAFNNNGQGVRGDMKAVITAILLDSEARCANPLTCAATTDLNYGHLREPVLFITNILRAFNATSDGTALAARGEFMGQELFYSPTVFNYYRPNFVVPGTTLLGPEFTIQDSSAAINRAQFLNPVLGLTTPPLTGTAMNLSGLQALSAGDTTGAALVDELNRVLMHGTMSTGPGSMRERILQAILTIPTRIT